MRRLGFLGELRPKVKDQSESENVRRFTLQHYGPDLSLGTEDGVILHVLEDDGGRLRLMIEVDEQATTLKLRKAIELALRWRRRLTDYQGIATWGENGFLNSLKERHSRYGETWSQIAQELNKRVAMYLQQYANYYFALKPAWRKLKTFKDYLYWEMEVIHRFNHVLKDKEGDIFRSPEMRNEFGLEHAREILEMIGLKKTQIDEALKIHLDDLEHGNPLTVIADYPISGEKIRLKVQYWLTTRKQPGARRSKRP